MFLSAWRSVGVVRYSTTGPLNGARNRWSPPFDSDPVASAVMRRGMFEGVADGDVLVIGTHFAAPTAGYIKRDGGAYRFDGLGL